MSDFDQTQFALVFGCWKKKKIDNFFPSNFKQKWAMIMVKVNLGIFKLIKPNLFLLVVLLWEL